jgi:ribose transport system permease protein/putative xylitol transport system permease protein
MASSQVAEPVTPPPETIPPPDGRSKGVRGLFSRGLLTALLPTILLILLLATFGILAPQFLSIQNFSTLCAQAGPLLLIASGATFVMLTGGIDLSVAGIAAFTSAVTASCLERFDLGSASSVIVGVLAGGVVGLVNGLIVTKLRLPSFIVTLGTLSVLTGLTLHILNGQSLVLSDFTFSDIATGQIVPNVPNVFVVALLIWVLLVAVNARTRLGRYVVAVGAGERVARLSGVPVDRYKIYAFILSGLTAGLGGVMLLAYLGSATPNVGAQYLLLSIAAIVVGGTSLTGGVGGVNRTIIGVILLTILTNGLDVIGISPFTQNIIQGVVVIVAVLFTIDRTQLQDMIK